MVAAKMAAEKSARDVNRKPLRLVPVIVDVVVARLFRFGVEGGPPPSLWFSVMFDDPHTVLFFVFDRR